MAARYTTFAFVAFRMITFNSKVEFSRMLINRTIFEFAEFRLEENGLFRNLTDLGMQRSPLQAFGFWLAYMVFGLLVAGIVGAIAGLITAGGIPQGGFDEAYEVGKEAGEKFGDVVNIIYVAGISVAVCVKKSIGIGWYLLAVLAAAIAILGVPLGLIPAAILVTRPITNDHFHDRLASYNR